MRALLAVLILFPMSVHMSHAASCAEAVSGAKLTSVAELYTSEGCDSCPPADRWFSTLSRGKNGVAVDVIPLAFHVDYWDYIGWKDRFAQAAFTDRQRAAVNLQGSRTVYTPQVMLNGKDVRQWSSTGAFDARVRDAAARAPRATLKLTAEPGATSVKVAVNVNVTDANVARDAALFLALTENNLVSRVSAGENKGATLKHDHVVRQFSGAIALGAESSGREHILPLPADAKRDDLQIVAFVQNTKTGEILQALGTALCAK